MKKNNKNGFVLAETIAVAVIVMTSLVIVYTQFMTVNKSYFRTFNYNSVNNLYLVNHIKNYIVSDGISNLIDELNNKYYVDFTSCPTDYFNEYIYCEALIDALNVKKVIFTKENLKDLNNNLDGLSEQMKEFIKYINYQEGNRYRLIVEFYDDTYATLLL